jgi:hypothetical protein
MTRLPALAAWAALAAVVVWWCWRALHDGNPFDAGLFYHAGQFAWAEGRPEQSPVWDGTPLLAAVMALASRVVSQRAAADVIVLISAALWLGAVTVLLRAARGILRPMAWWVLAVSLITFAPLMSTMWEKQLNAIVLVLGALGFRLVTRGRARLGALAVGVSLALKPLLLLLPLVLLARRETRRAGALAIAWIAGLSVAGLALLAWRAHDLGRLDPVHALTTFTSRSGLGFYTCAPWNYSPGATICRLTGYWPAGVDAVRGRTGLPGVFAHAGVERVAALVLALALALWTVRALRGRGARSWEVFAFVCPLSAMLSPLAWSHYQILLAPLFVLLWIRFVRTGAGPGSWLALAGAFVLASLSWAPYGSLLGAIAGLFTTVHGGEPVLVDDVAQFAQYVLLLCGIWWYGLRGARPAEAVPV